MSPKKPNKDGQDKVTIPVKVGWQNKWFGIPQEVRPKNLHHCQRNEVKRVSIDYSEYCKLWLNSERWLYLLNTKIRHAILAFFNVDIESLTEQVNKFLQLESSENSVNKRLKRMDSREVVSFLRAFASTRKEYSLKEMKKFSEARRKQIGWLILKSIEHFETDHENPKLVFEVTEACKHANTSISMNVKTPIGTVGPKSRRKIADYLIGVQTKSLLDIVTAEFQRQNSAISEFDGARKAKKFRDLDDKFEKLIVRVVASISTRAAFNSLAVLSKFDVKSEVELVAVAEVIWAEISSNESMSAVAEKVAVTLPGISVRDRY